MKFTELMSILNDCYDNKTEIIIYWDDSLIIKSDENTGSFETDNGLDLDDEDHLEYYACAVRIKEILHKPSGPCSDSIKVGGFIEISELNEPLRNEAADGTVLWQK